MSSNTINPILAFGEKFPEYLILTGIVSRGTGPAKFNKDDKKNDAPIVYDTSLIPEKDLSDIWRDKDVVAARTLALVSQSDRTDDFEEKYAIARRKVLEKSYSMFNDLKDLVQKIKDPIERMSRFNDFQALQLNLIYAAHDLGEDVERLSFDHVKLKLTGSEYSPSIESIDIKAKELEALLGKKGFGEGDLQTRIESMEKSIGYIKEDEVVDTYKEYMTKFIKKAAKMLGVSEDYFKLEVNELPSGRNNTGSFEYEGNGKIVTSIRKSDTTTLLSLIRTAAHEATHLLQSVLAEEYFNKTGDKYAAGSTMCSASVILNEGMGELGTKIYQDVVEESLGEYNWMAEILNLHSDLKRDVMLYTAREAHQRLADPNCNIEELQNFIEETNLKYGVDKRSAETRAKGLTALQTKHKALFYWPLYGIGKSLVTDIFSQFESIEDAFKEYAELTRTHGPLSINAFQYAVDHRD